MKIHALIPILFLAILSACTLGAVEPTVQATPEPVQETAPTDALMGTNWMWVRLTDPTQQFDVENPENYLLNFSDDGSLVIKADCNQARAVYTSDEGSITIEVGPMTRAMCPEGSRSDQFVQLLNSSVRYFFEDDMLFIDLLADGGTISFMPSDLDAGQAPNQTEMEQGDLTGMAWQWEVFTNPTQAFEVEEPGKYLLVFNENGVLSILADCNLAQADYSDQDGALNILTGPATTELCPDGSRSEQLLGLLSGAARYFFEDGWLYIDLMADGGTLGFSPLDREAALESFQAYEEPSPLSANTWEWVGFTDPLQQFQVEEPGKYLLNFNPDGALKIAADCNIAQGSYAIQGQSLSLEIGPSTLAACPEGSRSEQFLGLLPDAAIYFFQDGHLFIDLMADGGTFEFAPVLELTDGSWGWVAFTNPVDEFVIRDPSKYQLIFNQDGLLNITADCNLAQGSYNLVDQRLTIQVGPTTLAACPEGSRSEQFLQLLPGAAIAFFEDGDLFIDLMADGGTFQFAQVP